MTLLNDELFVDRHRRSTHDFTRDRVLTFQTVVTILMAKGMKSIQLSLNEFIPKLGLPKRTVSRIAYGKARMKLKHAAFIELNREAVIRTMYESSDEGMSCSYQTFHGFRILAVDGSQLQLPKNADTEAAFGTKLYRTQYTPDGGQYCCGLVSVLYDVLNHVALDAVLTRGDASETDMAIGHMRYQQTTDLTLYDRGYCGYRMLARASQASGEFVIRCKTKSFIPVNTLFTGEGPDDIIAELHPNHHVTSKPNGVGLPKKLRVRFVRIQLDTGEYEVLATSLLDQEAYPPATFKELYWLRWGIETFYGVLKTRLGVENFSGYSAEAIQQDFHAAVLLTGIESILTDTATMQLEKQRGGYPKRVNKAVSFNAIKNRAFELFMSGKPEQEILEELTELFQTNPITVRKDREQPRKRITSQRTINFLRRKKKLVF